MMMIPLPFLFTVACAVLIVREVEATTPDTRNPWLLAFIAMLGLQTALIGLRFGYDMHSVMRIQPLTAATLPLLGWFAFWRPTNTRQVAPHLLALVGLALVLALAARWVDSYLAALEIGYALALIRLGTQGDSGLGWAGIGRLPAIRLMLWLVAGLLLFTGLTDALIVVDVWRTNAANTGTIATLSSLVLAALIGLGTLAYLRRNTAPQTSSDPTRSRDLDRVFARIETLMQDHQMFTDPDLNLNRIARRLTLPARDVSRAINEKTTLNLSQYVNGHRIALACTLLDETDHSVTEIQFRAGFNTKSNFNREFSRVTGLSPSLWRSRPT